jgi:hypothetical protein
MFSFVRASQAAFAAGTASAAGSAGGAASSAGALPGLSVTDHAADQQSNDQHDDGKKNDIDQIG